MFATEFELLPQLANHPRVDLGLVRTQLDPMPRLGAVLGIDLYAKRDDTLPLAMGGNKVRQLEFYFGIADKQNSDTVLITGAVQSNFVRLCAAAARKVGWHPVIQLEDRVPGTDISYNNSGNVLLDRLLEAEIHYFPEGENEAAADANLDLLARQLTESGKKPYVIHLGLDHPPIGGLGYVLCALETYLQCKALNRFPDHIVIPSGSGLTHAGFLAGARAIGWQVPVQGICVRRNAEQQRPRVERRAREILDLLGRTETLGSDDVLVDDVVLPPGYGQLNTQVTEAMSMAARQEALLLEPVYSGRTMAGLVSLVRRGVIQNGQSVTFIHTGGLPSLFAYEEKIRTHLQR